MSIDKETIEEQEIAATEEDTTSEVDNDTASVEQTEEATETSETEAGLSEYELKINELNTKLEEVTDRLYRTQADFENFRRRTRDEREAAAKYRAQSLIEELLPTLDNFERALQVEGENEQVKSLLQGMEMVYRQLVSALNKEGVEAINPVGEEFDPNVHQAVMQVESEEHKSNEIVEVLQKGYKLKDRVIRPAMVKVNS